MPTEIERNRTAAANEARVLTAIRTSRIPPAVSDIGRAARLPRNLAAITINQLIDDGRVTIGYDERRQLDVYHLAETA